MKKLFLQMKPIYKIDEQDWNSVKKKLNYKNIGWYGSSGLDFDTLKCMKDICPDMDLCIMSDYGHSIDDYKVGHFENLYKLYKAKKANYFVNIKIKKMIPLNLWSKKEIDFLNKSYQHRVHEYFQKSFLQNSGLIYYAEIEIKNQRLSCLLIQAENSMVLDYFIKKNHLKLSIFCGICDGCRKGGAQYCTNDIDHFFMNEMLHDKTIKPDIWLCDHLANTRTHKFMEKFSKDYIFQGKYGEVYSYDTKNLHHYS